MPLTDHLLPSVSNGHPREQALVRRWWREVQGARGLLVWEYYLEGCYLDAVWFPEASEARVEASGMRAPIAHPLDGRPVVLCEAKRCVAATAASTVAEREDRIICDGLIENAETTALGTPKQLSARADSRRPPVERP